MGCRPDPWAREWIERRRQEDPEGVRGWTIEKRGDTHYVKWGSTKWDPEARKYRKLSKHIGTLNPDGTVTPAKTRGSGDEVQKTGPFRPRDFSDPISANIVYEITGDVTEERISVLRGMIKTYKGTKYPDSTRRIEAFKEMGLGLRFAYAGAVRPTPDGNIELTKDHTFQRNLMMIEYCMPQILADMIMEVYLNGVTDPRELVEILDRADRLKAEPSNEYPFYRKKVQDMLIAMATSMTASEVWDGVETFEKGQVLGGDGEIHDIENRDRFGKFLLESMKFDRPSNTKYYSMGILEDGEKYCMSLNVQIHIVQKRAGEVRQTGRQLLWHQHQQTTPC